MLLPLPTTAEMSVLQDVLDALPIAVFIKDAQSRVVLANKAAESLLGESLEQTPPALYPHEQQAFALKQSSSRESTHWNAALGSNQWCQTFINPIFDAQGQPQYLIGMALDISEQKRIQSQVDGEHSMLEMLATSASLKQVLNAFARNYETTFAGMLCSILLLDAQGLHLHCSACPSLPQAYSDAIDGAAIGPNVGSCGTAAYTGMDTVVADIATDPLWENYRDLALTHGLRACWSIPIISAKGQVLGTFAVYHAEPRSPSAEELLAIQRGAYMAGLAIEQDHTEQQLRAGQASLRESALRTQAILDNMADGVITLNEQGLIESFNKAAVTMFGYSADEAIGQNVSMLMPEPHRSQHDGYLKNYRDTGQARVIGIPREMEGRRRDGTLFPMSLAVSRITHAGQPTSIGIVRDITQSRRDEEEIRRLAFYDSLTELPNRRLLIDRLRQAMVTAARTGQHGAVILLDLDHFKQLNDTLGHDVGDMLLVQVAARLRTCVPQGVSVARLGGDEFLVLLETLSSQPREAAEQAEVVARKVLELLARPYSLRGHAYVSTPSIGIVVFMDGGETMDDLLKRADVAMYQSKAAGRNTIRFFDPATQAAVDAQSEMKQDIRRGLDAQEFVLHYQTQVDRHGRIVGTEALVRWNHPVRGMVSPAHFIPLAEESGLILPLGQWVLETACAQLVAWATRPTSACWSVSVNVSVYQFSQIDFVTRVAAALQKTGADPHLLKLELTESMLVDDMDDIIIKMTAIKAMGVSFSLDDFGTGYSSLSYLKRLPLDQLKIDQSFVRDVLTDPSDAVIARTVVALGHSLGLTVIAEGVETDAQRQFLDQAGCDGFQGYFFGRPVPAENL